MLVVKGRTLRDPLPDITIKHIYNESANFVQGYAIHFDLDGPSNHTDMVPLIYMGLLPDT